MAWAEKRGKLWSGRYVDHAGRKRRTSGVKTKREALEAAREEERKVKHGIWADPTAGKMTFSTYFEEHWLPNRIGEQTTLLTYRAHYRAAMKPTFGDVALRDIKSAMVQRWVIAQQKAEIKPSTIKARFKALSLVLGGQTGVSALRDGLIEQNPCRGVTLPRVDQREISTYSVEELDALMPAIPAYFRLIPLLAAESGLRWGELQGLRVLDFTPDFRVITVSQTIMELPVEETGNGTPWKVKPRPKSGKKRAVSIGTEVATLVAATVKERQLFPGDRLFSMPSKDGLLPMRTEEWPAGRPISRAYFRQSVWIPAHESTGIPRRRFHDLRGSHISWLLAGGADIVTVMERVGHSMMSTTQVYVTAMKDSDERALSALETTRRRARG